MEVCDSQPTGGLIYIKIGRTSVDKNDASNHIIA